MDEQVQLHAWVEGRVQGVGFRYFVLHNAGEALASGWVRNLRDGRVELVAEAPRQALEGLLAIVRQGPTGAFVSDVREEWGPATGEFDAFRVRSTL